MYKKTKFDFLSEATLSEGPIINLLKKAGKYTGQKIEQGVQNIPQAATNIKNAAVSAGKYGYEAVKNDLGALGKDAGSAVRTAVAPLHYGAKGIHGGIKLAGGAGKAGMNIAHNAANILKTPFSALDKLHNTFVGGGSKPGIGSFRDYTSPDKTPDTSKDSLYTPKKGILLHPDTLKKFMGLNPNDRTPLTMEIIKQHIPNCVYWEKTMRGRIAKYRILNVDEDGNLDAERIQ